jgi:hypothetical protein
VKTSYAFSKFNGKTSTGHTFPLQKKKIVEKKEIRGSK